MPIPGHFYLTELLLGKLKASQPSRIVCVSSMAHTMAPSFPDGPLALASLSVPEASYSRFGSYGISKLSNIWHAKALQRRLAGTGVVAVSLHPGVIATDLGRNFCGAACCYSVFACCMRGVDSGAATTVYCALAPGS